MVDINFKNLPDQQGYKIDLNDMGGYDLHTEDEEDYEHAEENRGEFTKTGRAFGSNDIHIAWLEGEPGATIPWHTHTPIMYQLYIPMQGAVEVSYKDNDGETHTTVAHVDEIVYLPPGAHNRVEAVGDEDLRLMVIEYETQIPRVEHLIEGVKGLYDPKNDPYYALELDSLRGRVITMDEDAVSEY